jgi:hypothetical protein
MKTYRSFWKTAVSLAIILVLAAGCSFNTGTRGGGEKATVTIKIPAISAKLRSDLATAANSKSLGTSKALMFATQAKISIFDSYSNLVADPPAFSPTQSGPGSGVESTFSLDVGSTYRVQVDVWNTNVQGTPLLSNSKTFTVYGGPGNWVSVPLIPTPGSSSWLSGGYGSFSTLSSAYDQGAQVFTMVGGESWFQFTADSEVAQVLVTPSDPNCVVYVGLYDGNGEPMSTGISPTFFGGAPDNFVYLTTGLTAGATYYLGMIALDYSGGIYQYGNIQVTSVAGTYPELDFEPNDSMATATYVPFNSAVEGTAYDQDWYTFTPSASGTWDVWFQFSASTNGNMQMFRSDGSTMAYDGSNYGTPKTIFTISQYLEAGTQYWVKGDFYGQDPMYGFKTLAGTYTLGVGLTAPNPWTLVDQFDIAEDTSSHSWYANGGSAWPVYPTLEGGYAWRLTGDGSSYCEMQLTPMPGASQYRIVWQNMDNPHYGNIDVYVNGLVVRQYFSEYFMASQMHEIIINAADVGYPSTLTVRFQDNNTDPNSVFMGTYIWLYQQ